MTTTATHAGTYRGRTAVGPYRVLDVLGEGGTGDVYLCEQLQPIRRRVAVKVLRRGMDSGDTLERFTNESKLLAMMEHPGIARVFDAGRTDDDLPYFVMEYVPGVSLEDYCRERQASVQERIALLMAVCAAVQHAHQKGVIHLDLKPSNILVDDVDGQPQPKIIDFGVARPTLDPSSSDSFVASPAYMSPEQALLDAGGIDTRSDIYSLGAILYELLAGRTPLVSGHRPMSLSELQRILHERTPLPPSRFVLRQRDEVHAACCGGVSVRGLAREVRRELDWITLKALHRDPVQRYATAADLAADLARFLARKPVTAARPSRLYTLRKVAERHRALMSIVMAMTATLIAFSVHSGWQAYELAQERDRARREAMKASESTEFMIELFALGSPIAGFGRDMTVRRALDIGVERIDAKLAGQPDVRAELLYNVARVYNGIGVHVEAERLLVRELANASPELRTGMAIELARARTALLKLQRGQVPDEP